MAAIRVVNIPDNTPSEYLTSEGYLLFDLPEGFRFTATKVRNELTDINTLRDEAALPFDIIKTPKNRWIVNKFISPNVVNKIYDPIPVLAYEGSYYFNFDSLFLQGVNDDTFAYTAQLVKASDFWLSAIRKITLNDLDFGEFEFTKANVEATWDNLEYIDGDDGFVFPLVDFGGMPERYFSDTVVPFESQDETNIGNEQLRPFFSLLAIMQKGFCSVGWRFRSPILETSRFRKVWCYLLSGRFFDYPGKGDAFWGFYGKKITPGAFEWELFSSPYYNPSLNASPIFQAFTYENNQDVDINIGACIEGVLPIHSSGNDAIWYFVLEHRDYNLDGSFEAGRQEFQQQVAAGETANFSVCFDPVFLQPGRSFRLKLYSAQVASPDARVFEDWPLNTLVRHNAKDSINLMRDDTFDVGRMLSKDYYFLDFIKGVAALGDFKWYTDYNTNTVYLYPRSYTYFDGAGVEGFLKPDDENIDMRGRTVRRSLQSQYPSNEDSRYVLFKFLNSTDEYIKSLSLDELTPIHSRFVDYKRGKISTTTVVNPFFEPTAEHLWNAITVPVIWDNKDGEDASVNINPRILYAVGNVEQNTIFRPENVVPARWYWDGTITDTVPYLSQNPQRQIIDGKNAIDPDWGIVYGYGSEDLYSKFIRSGQVVKRLSERHIYQMFFRDYDYRVNDFRSKWLMRYNGRDFLAELVEINNHQFNGQRVTNVVVYPEPQLETIPECFDDLAFQEVIIGHLEDHAEVISYNATETITFSANSFKVNGVEQFTSFPVLTIPVGSANVETINGVDVVTDIVDWLNTLGIPNYTFEDVGGTPGKCGASIKITYPIGDKFEFAFNLAEVWADQIEGDSENGLISVFGVINLTDAMACGDYYSGRWPGVVVVKKPVIE
jgi:hypothetical protein